jgi:hypothetical protein
MIVLSRKAKGGSNPPEQESSAQQAVPCPLASKTLPSSYVLIKVSKNGTHTPVELPLGHAPLGEKERKIVVNVLMVQLPTLA